MGHMKTILTFVCLIQVFLDRIIIATKYFARGKRFCDLFEFENFPIVLTSGGVIGGGNGKVLAIGGENIWFRFCAR